SRPISVIARDLNGDGRSDIATANSGSNTVSVLLSGPGGSFLPKRDYEAGTDVVPQLVVSEDINGDGRSDLVVGCRAGSININSVAVLLGEGDGTFATKADCPSDPSGGGQPSSVATADFNRDGHIDLAIANKAGGTVSILLGSAGGAFGSRIDLPAG